MWRRVLKIKKLKTMVFNHDKKGGRLREKKKER